MKERHLHKHDRQYKIFLYVFYACAVVMSSITFFAVYSMTQDWNENVFFSIVIGWYCVSRIGWTKTTNLRSYRMALLQITLLGFTIICLYEVLWSFTILNAEITSQMILTGMTPDIDALAIEYPDVLRPWNLIFATKIWLAGAIISGHSFYLSTKPRKSLEDPEL